MFENATHREQNFTSDQLRKNATDRPNINWKKGK